MADFPSPPTMLARPATYSVIGALLLLIGVVWFQAETTSAKSLVEDRAEVSVTRSTSSNGGRGASLESVAAPRPTENSVPPVASVKPGRVPLRRLVKQLEAEFTGSRFGQLVVSGGLRLAAEGRRAADGNSVTGSYFSPVMDEAMPPQEQMDATFDKIALVCDADVPDGTEVKLEFRTIDYAEDGEGWSDWREVGLEDHRATISLGRLAQKWQYRVTLSSQDPATGPVIRSVTIATEQSPTLAAEAFGAEGRSSDDSR